MDNLIETKRKRTQRDYTMGFKMAVVDQVEKGQMTYKQAQRCYGSPWAYDTYVPIVFAGAGLDHKVIDRKVHTTDIAPTLSAYLGIKPPSGSQGKLLTEILD